MSEICNEDDNLKSIFNRLSEREKQTMLYTALRTHVNSLLVTAEAVPGRSQALLDYARKFEAIANHYEGLIDGTGEEKEMYDGTMIGKRVTPKLDTHPNYGTRATVIGTEKSGYGGIHDPQGVIRIRIDGCEHYTIAAASGWQIVSD